MEYSNSSFISSRRDNQTLHTNAYDQDNPNPSIKTSLSSVNSKISHVSANTLDSLIIQQTMVEDRSKNPLYKALPPLNTTLKGLLNLNSKIQGFMGVDFRESLAANWFPTEADFFEDIGVQLAEKNFKAFCQKIQITKSSQQFSIPPIVHFIWMGSPPTPAVKLSIESWKKHQPHFEIKLWTEENIKNISWSSEYSKNLFNKGKNWAEKSDALRFEILYQFGGIYSDTDVVCLNSFQDLMTSGLTFFAGFESNKIKRLGRPLVGSAIIGASKNNPLIKDCIDFSQTSEDAPTIVQHLRSGPGPITKASYKALESGEKDILLLPCSYLYPMPWEKRLASLEQIIQNVRPESLAIHLWEGSWFDSYHPPKPLIKSSL